MADVRRASFDIDGVINMGDYPGIYPGPEDIIITGRSYQESEETEAFLIARGLGGHRLFMNPLPFDKKTRRSSGIHKGNTINSLNAQGYNIVIVYEDDPLQVIEIQRLCPDIKVVFVSHNLVEKENVRHYNK